MTHSRPIFRRCSVTRRAIGKKMWKKRVRWEKKKKERRGLGNRTNFHVGKGLRLGCTHVRGAGSQHDSVSSAPPSTTGGVPATIYLVTSRSDSILTGDQWRTPRLRRSRLASRPLWQTLFFLTAFSSSSSLSDLALLRACHHLIHTQRFSRCSMNNAGFFWKSVHLIFFLIRKGIIFTFIFSFG